MDPSTRLEETRVIAARYRGSEVMTRTTTLDAEAICVAIAEAMRKVDTRPSVFSSRVPEILAPCQREGCGAAIGQPCLPLRGEDRESGPAGTTPHTVPPARRGADHGGPDCPGSPGERRPVRQSGSRQAAWCGTTRSAASAESRSRSPLGKRGMSVHSCRPVKAPGGSPRRRVPA